jgi:Uma2 family endonuclease
VPGFARLAPDLVAEVVSPGQARSRMDVKARLYIASGVRLVWVVWPEARTVDVWREAGTTSLSEGDTLDGGDVLPGLAIPVRDLFT